MKNVRKKIKHKILDIFESTRSNSYGAFDEIYFMDFLTDPPHHQNTIKNSLKGEKKYYQFMYKLELEFNICFSLSELDRYYTVQNLTKKVTDRISKKGESIQFLKERSKHKKNYFFEMLLFLLLASLIYWQKANYISILSIVLYASFQYRRIRWFFFNRSHIRRMDKRL